MRDGLATPVEDLVGQAAVPDASALGAVGARALVIGCAGDDAHPVAVAERLASLLPAASLHVYDHPGVLWSARADLRERIARFLNG